MKTVYEDGMTMLEARNRYFAVNGFGPTGGYEDAWVDFKIGPIPLPFPNTAGRVAAVKFHDLHHILTGFDTNATGEFEISAWEVGAGCRGMLTAWTINLGGLVAGLLSSPRRTFRAFRRGRREATTYGSDYEKLLTMKVGDARARFAPTNGNLETTFGDVAAFGVAAAVGTAISLPLWAIFLPLAPVGMIALRVLRRRAEATAAA